MRFLDSELLIFSNNEKRPFEGDARKEKIKIWRKCVCVCKRERGRLCVCVCESERESECACVCERESE